MQCPFHSYNLVVLYNLRVIAGFELRSKHHEGRPSLNLGSTSQNSTGFQVPRLRLCEPALVAVLMLATTLKSPIGATSQMNAKATFLMGVISRGLKFRVPGGSS